MAAATTQTSCRRWNKGDKVLLALGITALVFAVICAATVLRASVKRHRYYAYDHHDIERRHHKHHGGGGKGHRPPTPWPNQDDLEEMDCEIEDIYDLHEDVECTLNERGEWCGTPSRDPAPLRERAQRSRRNKGPSHRKAPRGRMGGSGKPRPPPLGIGPGAGMLESARARPPPPGMDDGETDWGHFNPDREHEGRPDRGHHSREDFPSPPPPRPGRLEGEERRHMRRFPCMRMRVQMQHGENRPSGVAHMNFTEAHNFPTCSFSSCEENPEVNHARMDALRRRWEPQRHVPTRCLVNREDPTQIIILSLRLDLRGFFRSCGFHLTFWPFVFGVICCVALLIRRCCCKKTEAQKVAPERLPGGSYLVSAQPTEGMSEKEKEAFGISPPQVSTVDNASAPKDFLVLVPPTYDAALVAKPIDALQLPPPYVLVRESSEAKDTTEK